MVKDIKLFLWIPPFTTVKEDIERDPELEKRLRQAKKDILHNKVYSTDKILEMIEQGEF